MMVRLLYDGIYKLMKRLLTLQNRDATLMDISKENMITTNYCLKRASCTYKKTLLNT